jgi:hypothetical protein
MGRIEAEETHLLLLVLRNELGQILGLGQLLLLGAMMRREFEPFLLLLPGLLVG